MELYNVVTSACKIHSKDLQHHVSDDLPDYQWPQTTKRVLASKN